MKRCGGVAVPLFSIYSFRSTGIGEIPDLKLMVRFCRRSGLRLLQLLPLNDMDYGFRPYDADSAFALEPAHLSPRELKGVRLKPAEIRFLVSLKRAFPIRPRRGVNYGIKKPKMAFFQRIHARSQDYKKLAAFCRFLDKTRFWLDDYALYKTVKEMHSGRAWESWPEAFRVKDRKTLLEFQRANRDRIDFYKWLQWQLYEQLRKAKKEASRERVSFIGDIPFLVSRDSAEVWARQQYFRLDFAAGAPPDEYAPRGQRWGMPPYNWARLADHRYDYWTERLKYAENFYDFYRIDHAIGFYRTWMIPIHAPQAMQGKPGHYEPVTPSQWEHQGHKLFKVILKASRMLPCAEDLGSVPECSEKVLRELGIPGTDIPRWLRNKKGEYISPEAYRRLAFVTFSTHDMTTLAGWWRTEMKSEKERMRYWEFIGGKGHPPRGVTQELTKYTLMKTNSSACRYSVQLIQDWLSMDKAFRMRSERDRINVPGTDTAQNWRYLCPYPLEKLSRLKSCRYIRQVLKETGRLGP